MGVVGLNENKANSALLEAGTGAELGKIVRLSLVIPNGNGRGKKEIFLMVSAGICPLLGPGT